MLLNSITPKTEDALQIISMIDAGSAHNIVWEITHRNERNVERDWLFKIEKHPAKLIILSSSPIVAMNPKHWETATTDYPLSRPSKGKKIPFRLVVNARKNSTSYGRKFDLVEYYSRNGIEKSLQDMISEWMKDRESRFGFSIKSLSSVEYSRSSFLHTDTDKITTGAFSLRGTLQVTDPNNYIQTLHCGIGDQRSFGCGLLLEEK